MSQHGAHPNLPKSGAQRLAKQSSRGEIQADFMRTPDPGQSGYVDIYLMPKIDGRGCFWIFPTCKNCSSISRVD